MVDHTRPFAHLASSCTFVKRLIKPQAERDGPGFDQNVGGVLIQRTRAVTLPGLR